MSLADRLLRSSANCLLFGQSISHGQYILRQQAMQEGVYLLNIHIHSSHAILSSGIPWNMATHEPFKFWKGRNESETQIKCLEKVWSFRALLLAKTKTLIVFYLNNSPEIRTLQVKGWSSGCILNWYEISIKVTTCVKYNQVHHLL